jgi:hypothetical protein
VTFTLLLHAYREDTARSAPKIPCLLVLLNPTTNVHVQRCLEV